MSEEKYLGRIVKEKRSFKGDGTFEGLYAAFRWCFDNKYETGSMCYPMPIAIVKGQYNIPQKWKNMKPVERNSVDGVIISNDFREGEVIVYIFT